MSDMHQAMAKAVIDDARRLVWRTCTPDEAKEFTELVTERGYQWWSAGTGWVYLANFDDPNGGIAVVVDTQFNRWNRGNDDEQIWRKG